MRIAYCAPRIDWATLQRVEFYRLDWDALQALGHEVQFVTTPWQLRGRFDAALLWWWNYQWLFGPFLRARGIPLLSLGTFDVDAFPELPAHQRALKRFGIRFSQLHALNSRYEASRVPALGLPAERVRYCPPAVDTRFYQPGLAPSPAGNVVIANVAWQKLSNLRRKMVPELLEAFARIHADYPQSRLVLAGASGDGTAWLRQRAQELGIAAQVELPGAISREAKLDLYRNCTLYCQVSRYEGFGLATAEALACAAPVVVSSVAAVPEVVRDFGVYVEAISVAGIEAALRRGLQDLKHWRDRARAGSQYVRTEFSFERHCRDLRQLLAELLEPEKLAAAVATPTSST